MRVWRQEWLLACRSWADLINPLAFLVMVGCLFPVALDVSPQQLAKLAPGVLWMAILLAIMIDLPLLFAEDYKDGSIEQWLISGDSLALRVVVRLLVHWLFLVGPMLLICPLIGQLYQLDVATIVRWMLSVLIATPTLVLLGALISSLLLPARQSGALLAVLLLPLALPVVIFAVGICVGGSGLLASVWLLAAFLMLCLSVIPFCISAVLWLG